MALILLLETATSICSVALAKDGAVISLRENNAGFTHAENITLFIAEVCKEAAVSLGDLDAVAVSRGPGSYTGLRIGVSTAKGLCYALEKPLIAVETLKSLCCSYLQSFSADQSVVLLPMIDARRMEVYCAAYASSLNVIFPERAEVITENSFSELISARNIIMFGDGSAKCKPVFEKYDRVAFADVQLSAQGMAQLAEEKFRQKNFEDVSLFEPFYLKEAAIGIPGRI
jgi:tRNA threonylcarbamoyladenosine biosynthesis protein TsaB